MTQAALLVVFNNMNGRRGTRSPKQLQETPLEGCEAVRRLPREKLVVSGKNTEL